MTQELAVLTGHFHFLNDEREQITLVYKIVNGLSKPVNHFKRWALSNCLNLSGRSKV